ncbi:hypothetical protein [Nocardia sp. NPDC049707]|uniref:hypothetical protein n=1 Tax=Nocardia sp. NPDC049707 TaxID=3154735 RepID=UPI0034153040
MLDSAPAPGDAQGHTTGSMEPPKVAKIPGVGRIPTTQRTRGYRVMTAELFTTMVVIAAVIFFLWLVLYGLPYILGKDTVPEGAVPAAEILDRVTTERIHPAPPQGFTADEAALVLQQHLECSRELCDSKYKAYWTRVDAGLIRPTPETVR